MDPKRDRYVYSDNPLRSRPSLGRGIYAPSWTTAPVASWFEIVSYN